MENQELYQVNENGQLVVNWDSLELLTSKEFVKEIQYDVKEYGTKVFKVITVGIYVCVFTVSKHGTFEIFRYDTKDKKSSSDFVVQRELEIINEYRKAVKK